MAELRNNCALAASYRYKGKGERVRKTGTDEDIVTVYDEAGRWAGDYTPDGQALQQAIWLDGLPVGLLIGHGISQKLYYIQPDALGTPRVLIDPDRDVAVWRWQLEVDAFGDHVPNQDPDNDGIQFVLDMRFPGQRFDKDTGFNYNYFRDYEAATGRYSQSDPIGLEGGYSTYAYVTNNPLKWTDRRGLACDQRGCWTTPDEQQAATVGNWSGYYALACAGGDPYACRAGEVASNTGDGLRGVLSDITNRKLDLSIVMNQPAVCPSDWRAEDLMRKKEAIRRGLMEARVAGLRGASPSNPRQVDRRDISTFHHRVFGNNGAGADAFGGDLWDAMHGAFFTGYEWCASPACKP
jgi:RHS repeat-associated protein